MRRLAVLLSGALLVVALALAAGPRAQAARDVRPRARRRTRRAQLSESRLARAEATFHGGPTTTSTGETVDVLVSDALPAETATPEGWAEFFAHLVARARARTADGVHRDVRRGAGDLRHARARLLCARPAGRPGRGAPCDTSAEEVVRHEYGHHIAAHRLNDPWAAIDWGPKRWASAANVCARVTRKEAYPGDEGLNYTLNPGEAWAEVYRLVDERKAGITTATWPIIAQSFFPDAGDLAAAEQDVLQPWAAPRTRLFTQDVREEDGEGLVDSARDAARRQRASERDRPGAGSAVEVALVGANRQTVAATRGVGGPAGEALDGSVCGQRSLFVRVTQKGSLGRVRVSVTTP